MRGEYQLYSNLLQICPWLEGKLANSSEEEMREIAAIVGTLPATFLKCLKRNGRFQIQDGLQASRAKDSKDLSAAVVHWIKPSEGESKTPLDGRTRRNRGFQHDATGALLCPLNLDWSRPE